ncbi:PAS domain-containing sensor histidine kinase [Tamlana fucoidanivorans]|uniref:histidine kinase n=1 Tax=Allotamlana fucoidanivorans TaxID=2583814 RepID=A0A5C4SFC0_9FLAO|nr:PAS domain-containing sensor histidine kinase [Tamlana fucoidanivorans]TNJ42171.1 PAS domain S-box protein [Tamlana fucoidanivorans]
MISLSALFRGYHSKKPTPNNLKWRFAVKNSKIGVWDLDTKTNKVFYSTESKKILGFKDHEMKNTIEEWNKRVHPDDREKYFADFNEHLSGKVPVYNNEHRILCKNGEYKWILDSGKIISKDKNGKPTRIIGTHIDITQRKKNEDLLKENNETIISQNKRLYNFTHIVSHNLKTHIGNLKNVLEFYEETENKEEKEQFFQYLKTISNSLTTTITDLNEIISVKSEPVNVNEKIHLHTVVSTVLHNLEIDITNKNASIINSVDFNIYINGSESYLESIFHNLISNALKYSHPKRSPEINIKTNKTDNGYEIRVSDNGIGINIEKYKGRIFEMYQTFHESKRDDSKGIGLYLTKMQVEDLGGKISIDSILNEATTFKIHFPKEKTFLSKD